MVHGGARTVPDTDPQNQLISSMDQTPGVPVRSRGVQHLHGDPENAMGRNDSHASSEGGRLTGSGIDWKTVLITAHQEGSGGPCLHMLRAAASDGATYEVEAVGDDDERKAESMVFISDEELVFGLRAPIDHEADATMTIDFEIEEDTLIELDTVGPEAGPPMVLRSIQEETVHVLEEQPGEIILEPGRWNLQATAVPDDRERLGVVRFRGSGSTGE